MAVGGVFGVGGSTMVSRLMGARDSGAEQEPDLIRRVVGFTGELRFDTSKPDGTPRKLLDTTRLTALGWSPKIGLGAGIRSTYEWFLNNRGSLKT